MGAQVIVFVVVQVKPAKARCVVTVHGLCKLLETRLIRLCETIVEQLYEETEKDEPVVRQYLKELEKAVEFHKVFKPRSVPSSTRQ